MKKVMDEMRASEGNAIVYKKSIDTSTRANLFQSEFSDEPIDSFSVKRADLLTAKEKNILPKDIWVYVNSEDGAIYPHTLDFYSKETIAGEAKSWEEMKNIAQKIIQNKKAIYVYSDKKAMEQILASDFNKEVLGKFQRFPVTQLTPMFLDPNTRHFEIRDIYLIKIF
jgi:hypothetical protein